ncbi:thioredoxin family protein [Rubellicoccus peritrichatus]|uniref:Thioredoxin family protein n=1 Tax=Rubellicoccus peritrichatus TaxID=3080537 RepID=A0AAQ3QU21_9BACT|nr:thioredoxin family protein [Puniceicoccus sp. CR14]WOO41956.1 thioredoxin family protein [Puniceicoccus sp. CR14]
MKMLRNLTIVASLVIASALSAAVNTGDKAPNFSLPDADGKTRSLSDFEGQYVVLEWTNHGCPFVKKHYESGNMQQLQEKFRAKGVKWISICSSAPGKQGHMSGAEAAAATKKKGATPDAYLIDESGKVGKLYGAKATPEMFVIDPEGKVVYHGAIDSIKSTNPDDVKKANNYVSAALTESLGGKAVTTGSTRPYGCGVKYAK